MRKRTIQITQIPLRSFSRTAAVDRAKRTGMQLNRRFRSSQFRQAVESKYSRLKHVKTKKKEKEKENRVCQRMGPSPAAVLEYKASKYVPEISNSTLARICIIRRTCEITFGMNNTGLYSRKDASSRLLVTCCSCFVFSSCPLLPATACADSMIQMPALHSARARPRSQYTTRKSDLVRDK